ncbi:putative endo-1,3(4)-beta-glucanase 2-like [Capsicum annuum]|nr:putative endo-1,3(4)-beta-glucanase 2-like [Capsicum annuum]KAF3679369.1 putative endo-1,3(4)-beta-glucanase 2-like [Capsicum annuum]
MSENHQRIESELKQRKDELFCQREKVRKLTQENSKIKLDLERANRWTMSSRIVNHLSSRTQNERVGIEDDCEIDEHAQEHVVPPSSTVVQTEGILTGGKTNQVTYPIIMEFFEFLGVNTEISDMSLSVSLDQGHGCEWGTRNGYSSLFAQKKNVWNPYFWQMTREINRFKKDVIGYIEAVENSLDVDHNETLGQFIKSHGYSELFQKTYLVREELDKRGSQIRTGSEVNSVSTNEEGCTVACNDGDKEVYDGGIITVHAPDTLKMLGKEATYDETRILGAFQYIYSDIFLYHDKIFLPRNLEAWSACSFLGNMNNRAYVTYWLNIIQNLGDSKLPYLVTLDPPHKPEHTLLKWTASHPVPSLHQKLYVTYIKSKEREEYGFVEHIKAGMLAADGMLRRNCSILDNSKHMVPTWTETGACLLVTRFLKSFIETRCIILLEEGGTISTFQGIDRKCSLKVLLRIHSTQFYWKVATQADLGLADAFIHGDFSLVDKNEGLLNLLMLRK